MKQTKPANEQDALLEVEKWARLSVQDMKFYLGLSEALEDLDKIRAKEIVKQ